MDRLESMTMFVRVVETGSFSAVANELKTTQPTVSKHVAELENWLGAKLLNRSTRSLALTEVGRDYYERSVKILQAIEDAENIAGRLQTNPKGILRVCTVTAFGSLHLIPHLPGFLAKYPDISVELLLNDRLVDLVQEGVDIAIRVGTLPDSTLMARKLASCPRVTVATPEYLRQHGIPKHPNELEQHNCIVYTGRPRAHAWTFLENEELISVNVSGRFMTNNSAAYQSALLQGIGIANIPMWLVIKEVMSGQLLTVLDEFRTLAQPVSAVYLPGVHTPLKISCFLDFFAEKMAVFDCGAI